MKSFCIHTLLLGISICMTSCTVTNNLYVNNPISVGSGNVSAYLGVGTGVEAEADSISPVNGAVHFSNKISTAVNLAFGVQIGILHHTDLRIAIHFPKIIGGVGLRAGIQHSFFDSTSRINMAFGVDLGGVVSKDSIGNSAVDKVSNGAINGDMFMPFSYKINNDFIVVLTPRYSFNTLYIRKNQSQENAKSFDLGYPALSLGIRIDKLYLETTALYYNKSVFPHFGVAWLVH